MAKNRVIGENGEELVKMSELSEMSGVPGPTLKHYMREGLLPPPAVRTSPNMAYYDTGLIPRIQTIKSLQKNQYLPLHVIRDLLDESAGTNDRQNMITAVADVLDRVSGRDHMSREELLISGFPEDELEWLMNHDFVEETLEHESGEPHFSGDSLALIQSIWGLRKGGISASEVPTSTLTEYVNHLNGLISFEVALFKSHIVKGSGDQLSNRTEAAVTHSERILTILRRRALIPALLKK